MSKIISQNRQAKHNYELLETCEAGMVLEGFEVKSVRTGEVNLKDGFVRIENGEAFLYNVHISQYRYLSHHEYDPTRRRKLLLSKREIEKFRGKIQSKGLSLVPLDMHMSKKGLVKLTIALAKGRKIHDKRDSIKKKEMAKSIRREHGGRFKV